ncbi:hypothetical protein KF840_08465 [bacterium]|nr:hypothetical protein [bacterium]
MLSVVQKCNSIGCWKDTPITVVDRDVFIAIDIERATPMPTTTATVTPTATSGSPGFQVAGCVNEFPGEPCGAGFATVVLAPLGLTSSLANGIFTFDNIPPGNYVLSVAQHCNPIGCWKQTPVTLLDRDVFVAIDIEPTSEP